MKNFQKWINSNNTFQEFEFWENEAWHKLVRINNHKNYTFLILYNFGETDDCTETTAKQIYYHELKRVKDATKEILRN